MATEKQKPAESDDESDESRLRKALEERAAHLKGQLKQAEALPDHDQNKKSLVLQFKRHLDEVNKELRK